MFYNITIKDMRSKGLVIVIMDSFGIFYISLN